MNWWWLLAGLMCVVLGWLGFDLRRAIVRRRATSSVRRGRPEGVVERCGCRPLPVAHRMAVRFAAAAKLADGRGTAVEHVYDLAPDHAHRVRRAIMDRRAVWEEVGYEFDGGSYLLAFETVDGRSVELWAPDVVVVELFPLYLADLDDLTPAQRGRLIFDHDLRVGARPSRVLTSEEQAARLAEISESAPPLESLGDSQTRARLAALTAFRVQGDGGEAPAREIVRRAERHQ